MSLKKAVFITGAGSGIGAATAIEFARQGYFVYLLGRNRENLQEVALKCRHGASIIACDLHDGSMIQKKVSEVLQNKIHDIQVLVNNAGIFERLSAAEAHDDHWLENFQINMLAPARLARLFIPYFTQKGSGSIVNVSSTLALKPVPQVSAYAAMKAALVSWSQCLALELGPQNIRVNCICPGIVDTPIHSFHQLEQSEKGKILSSMASLQPLGRIGQPDEIARSIYFLGSQESSWTTGAVLAVDGGINLA